MRDKLSVLKEYFGHDSFREGQDRITDSLLGGHDVLGHGRREVDMLSGARTHV